MIYKHLQMHTNMSPPPTALEAFPCTRLASAMCTAVGTIPTSVSMNWNCRPHKTTQYCFYPAAFRYHCIWELIHPVWV